MVLQELGIGLELQSCTYIVRPEILWTMKFADSNYQYPLNSIIFFRTDARGYNPTRAQPVAKNEPKMYDYSGYAITSGINRKRVMMMMYLVYHNLISTSNHITCFDLLLQVILDTLRSQNEGNTQLVLRGVIPNEVVLYILWNIPTEMKISVSFKNSPQLVYLIIHT